MPKRPFPAWKFAKKKAFGGSSAQGKTQSLSHEWSTSDERSRSSWQSSSATNRGSSSLRSRTEASSSAFATETSGTDLDGGADDTGGSGGICAIIESRSREVGIAALDRRSMEFELAQFCDRDSYSRTVTALIGIQPAVVLVSRTARGTHLLQVLEDTLSSAGLPEPLFAERRHFDEEAGLTLLESATLVGISKKEAAAKFVAVAAFTALWRFAETSMGLRLDPSLTQVTFRWANNVMAMDATTARLLELVCDARRCQERGSIFGLFSCRTPGGSRLLRQSLLQPLATKAAIVERQEAAEVFLKNTTLLHDVQRLLPAIGDCDLLAARLVTEPKTKGTHWCKAAVRTALKLRRALAALPAIAEVLRLGEVQSSSLLAEASKIFRHARFPAVVEELDRVFDSEGPGASEGKGSMAYVGLMYAVRGNVSPLLDVARQTWNDALEHIHALHRSYVVKYPELNVKLVFTEKKGWYLSHLAMSMPPEFVRTEAKGNSGRQSSTTPELSSENFKLRQAEREILTQTISVLGGLYSILRVEAPLLYQVSHAASTLDLLQSFAAFTLMQGTFTRPSIMDNQDAPIAIKGARHPLFEHLLQLDSSAPATFEPFDYWLGQDCHFQTVTGANGGGKSTYLQTLAEMVVLAQIGCYLPAKEATIRIVSSLFTRIGSSDDISSSASSFLVEMQEAAHILRDTLPESLVLIDELGRGTAHVDGLAICWATCEKLVELQTYTLFATHFFEICRLQPYFQGWRNMHVRALENQPGERGKNGQKQFVVHHAMDLKSLLSRPSTRYGLAAAKEAQLPPEVLVRAEEMAKQVDAELSRGCCYRQQSKEDDDNDDDSEEGEDEQLVQQLRDLARSSLPPSALAQIIRRLQQALLASKQSEAAQSADA
mmetsp:Transcript_99406/g.207078  ORF Transcript_99406/g.207078 Transcript_99406/m.207078 type:complete len:887 (-) Transcript_99406:315-2975(-)